MRLVEKQKIYCQNRSFSVDPYHYKHSFCFVSNATLNRQLLYYYYGYKLHLLKLKKKKAKQFCPISKIVSNQYQFMVTGTSQINKEW